MTDTAAYVTKALAELDLVKSEASLAGWDAVWIESTEYLSLPDDDLRRQEDARSRKFAWLYGVGAG